ncbi:CCA tRNA nucleotidyltransferase [Candidatus Omnitrophota bacterium]
MKIDLSKKIPRRIFNIIKVIGKTADKEDLSIYIVGGPVRDILLNVPNYDLDFVVEGDGLRFSEVLNKTLKGDLKTHRAFGTATITYKDFRIDIVTARKESYKRPAAYPDVKPGTIKQDLFRRDFTINAMAISINNKDFGKLVDFYNGARDLKKGSIRVMHDKSFIDDPTRIFRAIRFRVRFDFKIEPHTKKMIKEAVLGGFLGDVNRGRIRKEIELFLKEKKPLECLEVFSDLI